MAKTISIDILFNAINRAGNTFSSINGQVNKLENRVQNFNSKVSNLFSISSMVGVGAGIGFLKLGADMEQNNVAFKVMMGSAEKATDVLGKLNKFANITPFSNKEVIQSGRNLIAFGIEANNLESTMQRVGDVASGVRMPFTELAEIYGKIKVGNTAYNEDLNQLAGRGIPIFTELAKVMKVPENQIKKLSSEGKITFKEIDQAFVNMTSKGGKYAGMMEEMSKTGAGSWSTALGKMTDGVTKLSVSVMPVMTNILNGVIPIIDKVTALTLAHPELMKNILLVGGGLMGLNIAGKVFGVMRAGALVASSGILQPIAGIGKLIKATSLMNSALAAGKLGTYSNLIARYGMAGKIAAGGIWLKNAALTVWNKITGFSMASFSGLIAKTWAWTAALFANPITWVVAGVVGLVAVLALAWKHFDGFRGGVVGAWEGLKVFGSILIDSVLNPLKQLLSGIGKIGSAISLLFKKKWSEAAKMAFDGIGDIGGAALKMNPIYTVSQVINRRDEIANAATSGYQKGKAIDTSNFLNFSGAKKSEKPFSATDLASAGQQAPFEVWRNPGMASNNQVEYLKVLARRDEYMAKAKAKTLANGGKLENLNISSPLTNIPVSDNVPVFPDIWKNFNLATPVQNKPAVTAPSVYNTSELNTTNLEQLTKNITQNIANNNTTNQNNQASNQKIEVTYSPQVNISATMTKENTDNLMKMLYADKDTLMKLIREEQRKDGRLSYAG